MPPPKSVVLAAGLAVLALGLPTGAWQLATGETFGAPLVRRPAVAQSAPVASLAPASIVPAPAPETTPGAHRAGHATTLLALIDTPDGQARLPLPLPDSATENPAHGASWSSQSAIVDAWLTELAPRATRPAQDARLSIAPGPRLEIVPESPGWAIDQPAARARLLDALRASRTGPESSVVNVPLQKIEPRLRTADLLSLRQSVEQALGQPIHLRLGDQRITLPAAQWAPLLPAQEVTPGAPARLDQAAFRPIAEGIAQSLRITPGNARLQVRDGRLEVLTPAVPGREVPVDALIDAIEQRLVTPEREVDVPFQVVQPAVRAETIGQLGIREFLGQGVTPTDPDQADRSHNVELAARHLHGLVIAPGEVFSFNRAIGPARTDAGFRWGWGIAATPGGPRMVPSEAGGICQVATTLFQAAFWSGLEIVERRPHTFWLTRYGPGPTGRIGLDATVDDQAGVDFRFRNTTGQYLLIQAAIGSGALQIQLYGTNPGWQVSAGEPVVADRREADYAIVRQPTDRLRRGQEVWLELAGPGFAVSLDRIVRDPAGQVVRRDTFRSHYVPSRNVLGIGTG